MWRTCQSTLIAVALVAVAGCASTKFESSWTNAAAPAGELQGKRVAAFVISDSEALRRSGEDTLAKALTQHEVMGIPGYRLARDDEVSDHGTLRAKLQAQGIDAMVQMRIVNVSQVVSYAGSPGPYWGWSDAGYGWTTIGYGGYYPTLDTVVKVETSAYSLRGDDLLWTGVTNTTNPKRLDSMIKDVADKSIKEMQKRGLVLE